MESKIPLPTDNIY
jgi:hypothetical protein